jgi:hypothetical protein
MKKLLLLITLLVSVIALASAQTPAESQKIRRMLDSAYKELANSGITQGPTQSREAIARERQALNEIKAAANYMLRVGAKRDALILLKQAAEEKKALDHYKNASARPGNVIVNVNIPPFQFPNYNSRSSYVPYHSNTTTFQSDGTGGGTFYRDGSRIGTFKPDGTGGGTFYDYRE